LSLRAALANWRPIAVYALLVFVLLGIVPTFLAAIVALLTSSASDGMRAVLSYVVILPYIAIVVATLQIADYIAYRDVFHAGEALAPLGAAERVAPGAPRD
jgi:ABC-type sugar transport system permease subunit